ncbi:hypothetical protein A2524_01705 [Candidatus Wolfebacteria bacterium RIFOXYD12_FULL_48_21]|uniref:Uncharacterized protein n=1 Tax=Candidatus Wolfebacteria bacterium RIFOXYD1_FULL_48_65 TaxID=1802561 RepID=A0A1F8E0V9_9BACT|nr:MAG: hypothetical protein A2610_03680 [Candidatus Wolfebacteria bacterium RIFOXYD1_FULL_48_65]OGM94514.1 MAG: hypothetical protein A2524_01705 [Candidatus Wolfebacteria bacterium RIFOXYD12_FULL_48_21]OGM96700.1 MAG: hypothetical protein A2532_04050 [Candidatus Wolfebacteria bacterium RIFOXYD2_FULL_48_11]
MLDIENLLKELSKKRPVFHSEADFQHALAWGIHEAYPDYKIRLEIRPGNSKEKEYLDIFIEYKGINCFIELKYKTKKYSVEFDRENFSLAGHSAHDIGRYDFIKDIQRVEKFLGKDDMAEGYAILLTNDRAYWSESYRMTVDKDFRVHEGRILQGRLVWDQRASEGTRKGRNKELHLRGTYECNWNDFSNIDSESFRYLLIKVRN